MGEGIRPRYISWTRSRSTLDSPLSEIDAVSKFALYIAISINKRGNLFVI